MKWLLVLLILNPDGSKVTQQAGWWESSGRCIEAGHAYTYNTIQNVIDFKCGQKPERRDI